MKSSTKGPDARTLAIVGKQATFGTLATAWEKERNNENAIRAGRPAITGKLATAGTPARAGKSSNTGTSAA